MMKTDTAATTTHFSNVLLTGTILLANVDMNGLVDYGLKAFLGGAVWLGYKLAADYFDRKRKNKQYEPEQNNRRNSGRSGSDSGNNLPEQCKKSAGAITGNTESEHP